MEAGKLHGHPMPSSRTASATILLALIVTGWCLVSAAVPVSNARRLQQMLSPVTLLAYQRRTDGPA